MHHAATAITAPDTDHLPAYWQFHDAVARAQLVAWLPRERHLIVDVSGPRSPGAELAALAGHTVLRVIDAGPTASQRRAGADWTPPRAEGRGADWTAARRRSEEGRRRVKSARRRAGKTERARQQREDTSRLLPAVFPVRPLCG